jgi:hypothetical protein
LTSLADRFPEKEEILSIPVPVVHLISRFDAIYVNMLPYSDNLKQQQQRQQRQRQHPISTATRSASDSEWKSILK